VLPFKGLDDPEGVAVDATGAVYVVDYTNGRVLKLPANSSAQTALPSTGRLGSPSGDVAVDTRGNVYLTVTKGNGRAVGNYLLKLDAGSDTWTALPSVGNEEYVAVDPNGTVYVITSGASGGVMKLAPGSGDWTEIPGAHRFVDAMGLAVDGGGNVYVTDHTGYRAPGGGSWFGVWHPHDDAEGLVVKLPAG
jgi:streptogramin lyase